MASAPDCVSQTFFRRTRKGRVLRVVRERYLRDDIGFGTLHEVGPVRGEDQLDSLLNDEHLVDNMKQILVLDTNVVLNQMDLLEQDCPALRNIILCDTVLQETRRNNLALYNRTLDLLRQDKNVALAFADQNHRQVYKRQLSNESANDYNDRMIRSTAAWFRENAEGPGIARVLLLTDDRGCLTAAKKEGVRAMSIHQYVKSISAKYPGLTDLLSHKAEAAGGEAEESGMQAAAVLADTVLGPESAQARGPRVQRTAKFPEHLSTNEMNKQIKKGEVLTGLFRVNPRYASEATVMVFSNGTARKITINGRESMNRAIDGDRVAVRVGSGNKAVALPVTVLEGEEEKDEDTDEEKTSEEVAITGTSQGSSMTEGQGIVVGIVERNWRAYAGSIDERDCEGHVKGELVRVVPVDPRVPKIRIRTRQVKELSDKRIIINIDSWSRYSWLPEGHFVKVVGTIGDRETETAVLLHEHDIPTREFSQKVMQCLPAEGGEWQVTEENMKGREDLRHLDVCSIDPPGCKDIDDALHVRKLPNGNIEVGVHIADVTTFVKPGTAIDVEAMDRGTSTYLVERRLDMLPGLLTTDICSLVGGVSRFAFSVLWEMTPPPEAGEKLDRETVLKPEYCKEVNVRFCKSVIKSNRAMAYGDAQQWIEDPKLDADDVLATSVRTLDRVAKVLRGRRTEAGALTLASPEVRFKLDGDSKDPTDVEVYQQKDANALVEEFMLLANITVAKRITAKFPRYAMLRRHPSPSRQMFDDLLASAAAVGVEINVDSSKNLADSLDLAKRPNEPFFNKLMRILTTRCMQQAVYFCSGELTPPEFIHYGLASPIYTHFTSPIRRYADVVVHRLLAAAEGIAPLPAAYERKDSMRAIAENINRRHHMAQLAGRASIGLHTLIFFKDRPTEAEATVLRVRQRSVMVMVPKYGIEGKLKLAVNAKAMDENFEFDEAAMSLSHKASGVSFRVFDPVTVKIEVIEKPGRRSELVVSLVKPNLAAGLISDAGKVDVVKSKKGTKREAESVSGGGSSAKKQKNNKKNKNKKKE